MAFRPETARPLNALVDVLLRSNEGLSSGERELIATFVSALNDCYYCQTTHGSVAAAHLGGNEDLVSQVKRDYKAAPITEKLKSLLTVAALVQKGGKYVTAEAIASARKSGASDLEIHDTVLISAAFCMFNRYVDGLDTWAHKDADRYRSRGAEVARSGYSLANKELLEGKPKR